MKNVVLRAVICAVFTLILSHHAGAFSLDQYLLGSNEDVRNGVNTVLKLMDYEKSGQWDKWAELLQIRAYPDLNLGLITTNEEFREALHSIKDTLVEYEVLNVSFLSQWNSIPVRPWLPESNTRFEGDALSETYYGVVQVEIRRTDDFGDGALSSFVSDYYAVKVDGVWKIHWSPWFAFEG